MPKSKRLRHKTFNDVIYRGGVLEDVLGHEDTFWSPWTRRSSPWPWPRGLKSSRPQVLENWPVLGSRTALFFELLKFCEALENFFGKRFFVEIAWKIFVKTFFFFGDRLKNFCEDLFFFFFLESTCAWVLGPWPWPRAFLSLALRVSALGKAVLGLGFFLCPWPWPRALCPRLHLWSFTLNMS